MCAAPHPTSSGAGEEELKVTVIIPVLNGAALLPATLYAINAGSRVPDELVVVDDRSSDGSPEVALAHGARVLFMERNSGPAACRNYAVSQTSGDILVFLDADTRVHADTVELLADTLQADSNLSAVIGAYDPLPAEPDMCSRFHNLAHCYVHRTSAREAQTFWSGCGAIRRSAFLRAGGFDEQYKRPSVEDIELGYRMTGQGMRILLDPDIMVTHLKRWSIVSACTTDIRDRGVPWMLLLLRRGRVPDDLNLTRRHRACAALIATALIAIVLGLFWPWGFVLALICLLIVLFLQRAMLRFVCRGKGPRFAAAAMGYCLLQEICKVIAAALGTSLWLTGAGRKAPHRASLLQTPADPLVSDSEKLTA